MTAKKRDRKSMSGHKLLQVWLTFILGLASVSSYATDFQINLPVCAPATPITINTTFQVPVTHAIKVSNASGQVAWDLSEAGPCTGGPQTYQCNGIQ